MKGKSDHAPGLLQIFHWLPSNSGILTRHKACSCVSLLGFSVSSLPHSLLPSVLLAWDRSLLAISYHSLKRVITPNVRFSSLGRPQFPVLTSHHIALSICLLVCVRPQPWGCIIFVPAFVAKCHEQSVIPHVVEGVWIWVVQGICHSKLSEYWHEVVCNIPFFSF